MLRVTNYFRSSIVRGHKQQKLLLVDKYYQLVDIRAYATTSVHHPL